MESHPSKEDVSNTNTSVQNIPVPITDNMLLQKNIVKNQKHFFPVNMKQVLEEPIRPQDVIQSQIGNCFFLASLVTILERDPDLLKDIIKVNKRGLIEVTFHSANDPNKTYTYIMEATKVKEEGKHNNHTHDAIFLLEKAYAIHRMETEPLQFTGWESQVRKALLDSQNNADKAFAILKGNELPECALKEAKLKMQISQVREKYESGKKDFLPEEEIILDRLTSFIPEEEIFEELKSKIKRRDDDYIRLEIPRVLTKMKKEKIDYASALKSGFSRDAFAALLGTQAQNIAIPEQESLRYFLSIFLASVSGMEPREYDDRTRTTMVKIFGDITSPEALYFIAAIKNTNPASAQKILFEYDSMKGDKPNLEDLLKDFLQRIVKWPPDNTTLDAKTMLKKTMLKLITYINEQIPPKRGVGRYIAEQNSLYDSIQSNLQNGNLVTVDTLPEVASFKEGSDVRSSKGLRADHSYSVENCYERADGRKYIVLRNPWGHTVRGYNPKTKIINGQKVETLSAVEKKQLKESSIFSFSFKKSKADDNPIVNSALPVDYSRLGTSGYFELELGDLSRRFERITVADKKKGKTLEP